MAAFPRTPGLLRPSFVRFGCYSSGGCSARRKHVGCWFLIAHARVLCPGLPLGGVCRHEHSVVVPSSTGALPCFCPKWSCGVCLSGGLTLPPEPFPLGPACLVGEGSASLDLLMYTRSVYVCAHFWKKIYRFIKNSSALQRSLRLQKVSSHVLRRAGTGRGACRLSVLEGERRFALRRPALGAAADVCAWWH